MRWLKFIYEQYLKDINSEQNFENLDKETISSELKEKIKQKITSAKPILKKSQNKKPKVGEIYIFGKALYFAIAETEEYPYKVYIATPYWELCTHEDLIVEGKYQKYGLTNIIRYVSDETLSLSMKIDEIDEEEIKLMNDFLEGKIGELPKAKRGMQIEKKDNYSLNAKFKTSERERSILLLADVFFENEEIPKEIEIELPLNIQSRSNLAMAAASKSRYAQADFGDIFSTKNGVKINFKKQYCGDTAIIYLYDEKLFSGVLPEILIIKGEISAEEIKQYMRIKLI